MSFGWDTVALNINSKKVFLLSIKNLKLKSGLIKFDKGSVKRIAQSSKVTTSKTWDSLPKYIKIKRNKVPCSL